jgi:hypothetical protein
MTYEYSPRKFDIPMKHIPVMNASYAASCKLLSSNLYCGKPSGNSTRAGFSTHF